MRKMVILALAVLVLASATAVEAKHQSSSQSASVKSEIDGGHHNTIITNIDQTGMMNSNGNIPYGQLKKTVKVDKASNAPYGDGKLVDGNGFLAGAASSQSANITSQIVGGHHNTVLVGNRQVAVIGVAENQDQTGSQPAGANASAKVNLTQALTLQNQMIGGHHNVIMVESNQTAQMSGVSGSLAAGQIAEIYNQMIDGHHNVILVGSSQTFQA